MTIADTIKNLKPGDRVRVTREHIVESVAGNGVVYTTGGSSLSPSDPIISIEVIERPLQVGDQVHTINGHQATILAIAEDHAMLKFRDKSIGSSHFKNLKRI